MPVLHVSQKAAIKMSAVATDTGISSRINCERICLLAHSQGCWQDPISPGLLDLRASFLWLVVRSLSQCLATWASPQSTSLQNRWISSEQTSQRTKESQQDKSHVLCNLIWKVTSHHLCWILLIRGESLHSRQ